MNVDELTARLSVRFGPGVAEWCAGVPELTARLVARWGLVLGAPYDDGGSSLAIRCTTADGRGAVLKLTPDHAFLAEQAAMLRSLAPSGRVPEVFAVDRDAVLLEAVVPGGGAAPSAVEWAGLMRDLHAVPPPVGLERDVRGRIEEAFARIGRRLGEPVVAARVSRDAWDLAFERCQRLLATQTTTVLLHGDLHPGNVLDGGARGLVAIDPKTCVGDPCFDAMDYVVAAAGSGRVGQRCREVADAYGLDRERLRAWSQVDAPMAVIGHLTWGGPEGAVEELLDFAS